MLSSKVPCPRSSKTHSHSYVLVPSSKHPRSFGGRRLAEWPGPWRGRWSPCNVIPPKPPKEKTVKASMDQWGLAPFQAVRCPELPVFQRPAPAPASQEAAARAESAERGRKRGLKTSTPITCPGIPYVTTLWRHWRRGGGPRFHIGGSRHAPSIHIPHRRCHARPWSLKVPPLCLPQAGGSLRKQTTTTTSFCRLFHPRALPPRHHRLQTPQTQSCSALRLLRLGSAGLRRGVHRTKGASLGGLERLCAVVAASFPPSSLVRGSL